MNQKIIWISITTLLLLIILLFIFLKPTHIDPFHIYVKEGSTEVLTNDWETLTKGNYSYKDISQVKTLQGKTLLVSKQSLMMTLTQNTEIHFIDNNKIEQLSGTSKNSFLSTDQSTFEIKTRYANTKINSTNFQIIMSNTEDTFIVGQGTLTIDAWESPIQQKQKLIVYQDGSAELKDLNSEEIISLQTQAQEDLENIKSVRKIFFNSYQNTISSIKSLTRTTNQDFQNLIKDIDEGRVDDKKKIEESPIPLPKAIDKVLNLNQKIKEQKNLIQ